ncbi:hypothetical protein E5S67_05664 [Microcoleus sp. IPMA8]|uniref:Uncharacterized protein n=1 Tax=Microcoleus asticus IPMA8 TaxID=2563858 RepID=A0ABX2D5R8_9CYAN|nr:hypothetical protein [Microcoleus asticus IPMA8]
MESKIVFPDAAVRYGENQMPKNVEDNHKKGAFSGVSKSIDKIAGGNKIALPTVPTAQIS